MRAMTMQQGIGLKLRQKPVLTQSLRQLVELLALNRLDLRARIDREMEANPVLETADEADAAALADGEPEWESEPAAEPGNALEDIDFEKFYEDCFDEPPRGNPAETVEKPSPELFLAAPTTLSGHLLGQLSLSPVEEDIRRAAEFIIGNLSDDGYLQVSLNEIAAAAAGGLAAAERALRLVQGFDPLGVAARNLRECLSIQLRAIAGENCPAFDVLSGSFDLLERGETARAAAALGRSEQEAARIMETIRALDPRPGQRYRQTQNYYVEPDVYFVRTAEGFRAVLNEEDLPELRVNRGYRRLLERGKSDEHVRHYVRERYNAAFRLLRNIEQRRQTIRRTCEAVIRRQAAFLAKGADSLLPMTIKDVAEEIGVHPSTVSRAAANKYAHTPHGVYELRSLFSGSVQGPSGAAMPLTLLKRRVRRMIEAEDPEKPLTDDDLSKMLKDDGIHAARRTVAKYREDLAIPSTHKRRRKHAAKIWENKEGRKEENESSLHGPQNGTRRRRAEKAPEKVR